MTFHPEGYMSGFGNEFATEALPGALPAHRNSPQLQRDYQERWAGIAQHFDPTRR